MSEILLNKDYFISVLHNIGKMVEENRDMLSKLDSDIGDGDHGINLSIGFRAINEQLDSLKNNSLDIEDLLKKAGMILLSKVGGASGPLYGSFFIKMGQDIKGKNEITLIELFNMFKNGVAAVKYRGKAELGEKTMLDALIPGINVLANFSQGDDPVVYFKKSLDAMKKGAEETIPLVAKKGRAMRLGERAIGHKDPGSESAWRIINEFYMKLLEL